MAPQVMQQCISDMRQVQQQVEDCKKIHQDKVHELNRLKQCHKHMIMVNENMKHTIDHLVQEKKKRENPSPPEDDEVTVGLIKAMGDAFAGRMRFYKDERDAAFDLLRRYHRCVSEILTSASMHVIQGKNAAQVVLIQKELLDQKILIIPHISEHSKEGNLTTIKLWADIIDTDSNESMHIG
ncbi:MAG: hypothetical protein ACPG2Y_02955, partial [Acholeplasmataceae bacterium]